MTSVSLLPVASKVSSVSIALTIADGADCSFALVKEEITEAKPIRPSRSVLRHQLGTEIQWLQQVHGTEVVVSTEQTRSRLPEADASYTTDTCALAVLTADCLPVVLYNDTEIAVVHAGWRSLAGGLIIKTLAHFNTPPSCIHAYLGPAIRQPSYQVGDDMRLAVLQLQPEWQAYFLPCETGAWRYDLAGSARHQLAGAGICSVDDCGVNTMTDTRFYSYRKKHTQAGRFATCVWRNRSL